MTELNRLTLLMHADMLNSPDTVTRHKAAHAICALVGIDEALAAISPTGVLNPPPVWPMVDVQPHRCEVQGRVRILVVAVRTRFVGVTLSEEWRCEMPLADGALADAADRGKWALARRIDGMVMV